MNAGIRLDAAIPYTPAALPKLIAGNLAAPTKGETPPKEYIDGYATGYSILPAMLGTKLREDSCVVVSGDATDFEPYDNAELTRISFVQSKRTIVWN